MNYCINTTHGEAALATADVRLEVRLEGIGLEHSAAQAAIGELISDLTSVPELKARQRGVADAGTKGAPVDLVVSLGVQGTIVGLVQIIKIWLGRDRRRSLTVSITNDDDKTVVHVEGEQVSTSTLTEALRAAKLTVDTSSPAEPDR